MQGGQPTENIMSLGYGWQAAESEQNTPQRSDELNTAIYYIINIYCNILKFKTLWQHTTASNSTAICYSIHFYCTLQQSIAAQPSYLILEARGLIQIDYFLKLQQAPERLCLFLRPVDLNKISYHPLS